MGLRLFRRITIIPGWLYLNLAKTSISFSFRKHGLSLTAGTKGVSGSVGLFGTGLFYRKSKSYSQLAGSMKDRDDGIDEKHELLNRIEEKMNGSKKK